jgi:phage/plasmid-associated DNA primase
MTGDYSMKATSGLLMAKGSEGHPTERTDLFSKKLVAAHESEQGHRLNDAFVKEATVGDPIRARRMREATGNLNLPTRYSWQLIKSPKSEAPITLCGAG